MTTRYWKRKRKRKREAAEKETRKKVPTHGDREEDVEMPSGRAENRTTHDGSEKRLTAEAKRPREWKSPDCSAAVMWTVRHSMHTTARLAGFGNFLGSFAFLGTLKGVDMPYALGCGSGPVGVSCSADQVAMVVGQWLMLAVRDVTHEKEEYRCKGETIREDSGNEPLQKLPPRAESVHIYVLTCERYLCRKGARCERK